MNDLTDKYITKSDYNPNLTFLIGEYKKYRILVLQGGTRSGKTFSIVDFVIWIIENHKGLIISFVRATLPSLKASVLRDFIEEMMAYGIWDNNNFNKSELEYRHNTNLIEFFSVDDEQKIRGRKRDILIGNEVNEIHQDKMMQLLLRTEGIAIFDFNPSMVESYIYDDILERNDCAMIVTTYKNNPHLSIDIINEIERLKETDEQLWKIYGCGTRGEDRAGIIYSRWIKGDGFPIDLPTWYGIDFGFSNDPTGIVRVAYDHKSRSIYLTEVAYQKELMNSDIARLIKNDIWEKETFIYKDENWDIIIKNSAIIFNEKNIPLELYIENPTILRDEWRMLNEDINETLYNIITKEIKKVEQYLYEVYCDSAEPKSIQELRLHGISAYPCIKGSGSIGSQIFFMYNFRILYNGENIEKERRLYKWKEKKNDKEFENMPIDAFNHILDASRYAVFTHLTRIGLN